MEPFCAAAHFFLATDGSFECVLLRMWRYPGSYRYKRAFSNSKKTTTSHRRATARGDLARPTVFRTTRENPKSTLEPFRIVAFLNVFDVSISSLLSCREFGRWKVNNLASERRELSQSPLPLTPEFIRNTRLLGRRPSTQMITENLIKKYGTHFLLSATLGGKQLSFFNVYFCGTHQIPEGRCS